MNTYNDVPANPGTNNTGAHGPFRNSLTIYSFVNFLGSFPLIQTFLVASISFYKFYFS